MEQASQDTSKGGLDCRGRDRSFNLCNDLPLLDVGANFHFPFEYPIARCAQHPFRISFRGAGVWNRAALEINASERVAAAGFHDRLAVLSSLETGTKSDI